MVSVSSRIIAEARTLSTVSFASVLEHFCPSFIKNDSKIFPFTIDASFRLRKNLGASRGMQSSSTELSLELSDSVAMPQFVSEICVQLNPQTVRRAWRPWTAKLRSENRDIGVKIIELKAKVPKETRETLYT
jgi:hypothetical protein